MKYDYTKSEFGYIPESGWKRVVWFASSILFAISTLYMVTAGFFIHNIFTYSVAGLCVISGLILLAVELNIRKKLSEQSVNNIEKGSVL